MVSKDLLDYIRIQQAQGFSLSQIRGFLKKNGYAQKIKYAFSWYSSKSSSIKIERAS